MIVLPRPAAGPELGSARYRNLDLSIARLIHRDPPKRQAPPPMPSRLERLPNEVQHMVFSLLDYPALIHLSSTNRHFHRAVDPGSMASQTDKAQFIMQAAKDFPQHRPSEKGQDYRPGNFECYVCYRVRAPDHFDAYQAQSVFVDRAGRPVAGREPCRATDRKVMLRRFCIGCGVREGLHAPFDCLTTKTGRDLWVCLCRKVWSKPGCMRCPDCAADCPLRPRRKT